MKKKETKKSTVDKSFLVPACKSSLTDKWTLDVSSYVQDNWSTESCIMHLIEGPTHRIVMGEFDIGLVEGVLKCRSHDSAP